jgi:hypothetical protein
MHQIERTHIPPSKGSSVVFRGWLGYNEQMQWIFFPKTSPTPTFLRESLKAFEKVHSEIDSSKNDNNENRLKSDDVLKIVAPHLINLGYEVECGKKKAEKISIPVLFGNEGKVEKSFDADAWHKDFKTVIEVEAGRAYANHQFLKDIFQASVMTDVDYLVIAVRSLYKGANDFDKISKWLEIIYLTNRIRLELKGILLIGY